MTSTALPPAPSKRRDRDKLEASIVAEAVRVFAECGYEGTAVADVADNAGLSKQNLMYYFPTKQALYQRVLDDVLDEWLERMGQLADPAQDPSDVLRAYVQAKLRFSREHPWASRVYAMEVISGAPLYGEQIRKRVVPLVRRDIEVFERWIAEGRIAPVNATHLLFAIWAMTQSYADFATQMALVLDRDRLARGDFEDGEKLITDMVLAAIALPGGPGAHAKPAAVPAALRPTVLATRRLRLRWLEPGDAAAMFAIFSDPQVMRYWSAGPWTDMAQADELIAKSLAGYQDGSGLRFGIELEGQLIGNVCLFAFSAQNRRCEIGYVLGSAHWGRGYATEALRAVLDYAFRELDLNRLEADIDPHNGASARVLERLGFCKEGHMPDRWIVNGETADTDFYGLLKRQWEAR
jgi:TetR/AcrR family transcriptional regulator